MLTDELAERVLAYADGQAVGDEPHATEVPGLNVARQRRPNDLAPVLYRPLFCLVLQGAKQAFLGERAVTFSEGRSVIVGVDLPTVARVVEASPARPYVALALHLDMPVIRDLSLELEADGGDGPVAAMAASDADGAIVDAMGRLFSLIDKPTALPVLRPLLLREIHYWLFNSGHGATLRALARSDSHAARISNALAVIRRRFADTVSVPGLAREAGMSVSAFHQHFKAVTGTTPLQYQKRLRLMEARRLMQAEQQSVSGAAFSVGYESPTQFSREYARMFGLPPSRHRGPAGAVPTPDDRRAGDPPPP